MCGSPWRGTGCRAAAMLARDQEPDRAAGMSAHADRSRYGDAAARCYMKTGEVAVAPGLDKKTGG